MRELLSGSSIRTELAARLRSEPFFFPEAVAVLVAIVYEPREQHLDHPEEFNELTRQQQARIRKVLREATGSADGPAIGEIERSCLSILEELAQAAFDHELDDIAQRLADARAVSRGELQPDRTAAPTPELIDPPEPRTIREGRPPVGRWR